MLPTLPHTATLSPLPRPDLRKFPRYMKPLPRNRLYPALRGHEVCALIPELTELNLANWMSAGHIAIQSEPWPAGNGLPRTFSLLESLKLL